MLYQGRDLKVTSVNVRRERAGDGAGPIAIDLKLFKQCGVDSVQGLFLTKHAFDRVLKKLYDADGNLKVLDVVSIQLAREITGGRLTLSPESLAPELGMLVLEGDVNKIRISPKNEYEIELSMRVQLKPNDEQRKTITGWLDKEIAFTAELKSGELSLVQTSEPGGDDEDEVPSIHDGAKGEAA